MGIGLRRSLTATEWGLRLDKRQEAKGPGLGRGEEVGEAEPHRGCKKLAGGESPFWGGSRYSFKGLNGT